MLNPIAGGIWEFEKHLTYGRVLKFPRRMTIVKLGDGALWIHNVTNLKTPGLRDAVDALGPVTHIVAPNRFHHFFVDQWKAAYPAAIVHAARGLDRKKPELPIDAILDETPPSAWGGAFEQYQTKGHPGLSEVIFFHPATRTLLVTDWLFNVGAHEPLLTRLLFRINGCYCRPRPSLIFRSFAKDKQAICKTVEEICSRWEFERIVMAHGMVTQAGPEELREAYSNFCS